MSITISNEDVNRITNAIDGEAISGIAKTCIEKKRGKLLESKIFDNTKTICNWKKNEEFSQYIIALVSASAAVLSGIQVPLLQNEDKQKAAQILAYSAIALNLAAGIASALTKVIGDIKTAKHTRYVTDYLSDIQATKATIEKTDTSDKNNIPEATALLSLHQTLATLSYFFIENSPYATACKNALEACTIIQSHLPDSQEDGNLQRFLTESFTFLGNIENELKRMKEGTNSQGIEFTPSNFESYLTAYQNNKEVAQ